MSRIYSSSGSEHEPDSAYLHEMVLLFMHEEQQETGNSTPLAGELSHPDEDHKLVARSQAQINMLKGILSSRSEVELVLSDQIAKFIQMREEQQYCASLRRSVMRHLRSIGYDAAICKSQPTHDRSFPRGKYEYMDVTMQSKNGNNTWLVVDIDFRAEFEIARSTKEYNALIELLPTIYVGNADNLQRIVKIMANGVKLCFNRKGMHVPPWRTYAYMQSKWLGSYKRTTNPLPSEQKLVKEDNPIASHGWKCCNGGVEKCVNGDCGGGWHHHSGQKRFMSRLANILIEAGLISMSIAEPTPLCQDEPHAELAVA